MKYFFPVCLIVFSAIAMGATGSDVDERVERVQESILALHTSRGPAKEYIVWGECGKRLRGENAEKRAHEYAEAIVASVDQVEQQTGELVDVDHVAAILYRESSNDECVIGRHETKRLTEELGRAPQKKEIMEHVKKWRAVYSEAHKVCKKKGLNRDVLCVRKVVSMTNPEYRGIRGWDLGAAQYRWPSYHYSRQNFVLPTGRVITRIGFKEIFDYEVSVYMLTKDLAEYKEQCRHHTHWEMSKWGRRLRQLDSDEAYYAHHHTGSGLWSYKYWKAVTRHLKVIEKRRENAIAKMPTVREIAMAH